MKVELAAGTTPGTYDFPDTLDQAFDTCTGVTLVPIAGNEDDILRVALKDDTDTHIHKVFQDFLAVSRDTPVSDRKHKADIKGRGNRITLMVEVTATLTARNAFDFVFHLENSVTNAQQQCPGTCRK